MIVRIGGISVELVVQGGKGGMRADRIIGGLGDRFSPFMASGGRRDLTLSVRPVKGVPWEEILDDDSLGHARRIARTIGGRFPFTNVFFDGGHRARRDRIGSPVNGRTAFGLLSRFGEEGVSVIPQGGVLLAVDHERGFGEALVKGDEGDDFTSSLANVLEGFVSLCAPEWGGIMLHASSLVIDGRGYAFVGGSGAGKSTIAGQVPPAMVLSDDGSLCAEADGAFWLYPTPFSRTEAGSGAGGRAPLTELFFLEKDSDDFIADLTHGRAMAAILLNHIHFFRYMCTRNALLTFDAVRRLCERVSPRSLHFTKYFDPLSFFRGVDR